MKKKSTRIFTIFALLIYALAIFYFVFNLAQEYRTSTQRTRFIFDSCISNLKKELPGKSVGSKQFNDSIGETFSDLNSFSYIEVFVNGNTVYKYQINDFENESESKLIKSYFGSFKIEDENVFVTANLYKIKPYSIYSYSRISFLIILIVTIIAIVLIILSNHNKNDIESISSIDEEIPENNRDSKLIEDAPITDSDIEEEKIEIKEEVIEETPLPSENTIIEEETVQEEETTEPEIIEENKEDKLVELPSAELKPVELNEKTDSPEGLFSPKTGLGWEQYLLTRLDSEINRAIASEFDLSLFIIKITNLSRDSDTVKKVCEYLTNAFQFKDLLFEYKEDCIVSIKISMNIDEAISFADSMYTEITELLKDSFAKCYIGISSKTIRMISGERLLREAEEALIHAQETNDSPIIGFRADAEKFRKYFENQ